MRLRKLLVPAVFPLLLACHTGNVDCNNQGLASTIQLLQPESTSRVELHMKEGRAKMVHGSFAVNASSATEAATTFLRRHASRLSLFSDGSTLVPWTTRQGKVGTYVRFQQKLGGLSVFGREVIVHVVNTANGFEVRDVNLAQHTFETAPALTARITETDAELAARGISDVLLGADLLGLELGVSAEHGLVYRVQLFSRQPLTDLEILVEAQGGKVVSVESRLRAADGTGLVFDPNPVASTGNVNLDDGNDQTSAALDAARVSVTLPRLDASGFLRGNFVDARPPNVSARAQNSALNFAFTRDNDKFEEVMAYFHIDRVQARIQFDLGFVDVNNRRQVIVTNAFPDDNSFYSGGDESMNMGTGGVDDAEDADILVHEYGHSIQDNQVPGWGGGDEGSMGEGFGDYLAASMSDVLTNQSITPVCVGDWDATAYSNANPPCLRRVDRKKHFPEATVGEVHDDGEMWAAALFAARAEIGADAMDTLVLESHFLLSTNESFFDAANALLAADQNVFAGVHKGALKSALIEQGLSRDITPPANLGNVIEVQNVDVNNPRNANGIYRDNLDDSQFINVPGAQGLRLHFSQIATEQDPGCFQGVCDNIYLYDADNRLFQILNGAQTNIKSVIIPGDSVRVRMVSDFSVGLFGYNVDSVEVFGSGAGAVCGNGIRELDEDCDGTDLGDNSCTSQGFDSGTARCSEACTLDVSACVSSACE